MDNFSTFRFFIIGWTIFLWTFFPSGPFSMDHFSVDIFFRGRYFSGRFFLYSTATQLATENDIDITIIKD